MTLHSSCRRRNGGPALLAWAFCGILFAAGALAQGGPEGVRPDIGKALVAAQELIKAGQHKEALAKIGEAEALGPRTPYESFIVERLRAVAATGAGDTQTAIRAYEAVVATDRLPPPEQLKILEALVGSYYKAKDYALTVNTAQRYFSRGGASQDVRLAMIQAQYLAGDCAGASAGMGAMVEAEEKTGRRPAEDRLQLLASCQLQLKDERGYVATLERLVTLYPQPKYWLDIISRTQKQAGLADRLVLDLLRLQFATGSLQDGEDYADLAQLAYQAGLPAEAKKVLEQGFGKGLLGVGPDGDKQKKLRESVYRQSAADSKQLAEQEQQALAGKDGNLLLAVGITYVNADQQDRGIALMEQALVKGGLRRPADAHLHVGQAYLAAGRTDKAIQTFAEVAGAEGIENVARLWRLHALSLGKPKS